MGSCWAESRVRRSQSHRLTPPGATSLRQGSLLMEWGPGIARRLPRHPQGRGREPTRTGEAGATEAAGGQGALSVVAVQGQGALLVVAVQGHEV